MVIYMSYIHDVHTLSSIPGFCSGILRHEMETLRRAVEQEHGNLFSSAYEQLIVSSSDDCQESTPHHGQCVTIAARLSAQCAGLITLHDQFR